MVNGSGGLRSTCPVCKSTLSRHLYDTRDRLYGCPGTFSIRACGACKSLFVANPPAPGELQSYYPAEYVAYLEGRTSLVRRTMGRVQWALFQARNDIPPMSWATSLLKMLPVGGFVRGFVHLPRGRHLDIGCGAGQFLEISRSLGMEAYGVEPSGVGVEAAQAKGLRVTRGTLSDGRFPADCFDLITMNHVFEHVDDPKATLLEASRILKPGGTIILATPNARSLVRYLFGKYWFQQDSPRHLQVCTPDSIALIAADASLRITSVRWIGHPLSFSASLYNMLVPDGAHTPRTPLHKFLVSPPVSLLFLPLTAVVNLMRLGDTIELFMASDHDDRAGQALSNS